MNDEIQELLAYLKPTMLVVKAKELPPFEPSSHLTVFSNQNKKTEEVLDLPIEYLEANKDKVNWTNVSRSAIITDEIASKFANYLDWGELFKRNNTSISDFVIDKNIDRLKIRNDWFYLCANYQLSEGFIEKYRNDVDWVNVCRYQKLSEEFMTIWHNYIDWVAVSEYQTLSQPFIDCFEKKLSLYAMTKFQKLSEEFLETHRERLYWENVFLYQDLPDGFIRRHINKIKNWKAVCSRQTLTEDFIEEFADKVDWHEISINQTLSEDFIRKFALKVDWDCISMCQIMSEDFVREMHQFVNWYNISLRITEYSKEFLSEFKNQIDYAIRIANS